MNRRARLLLVLGAATLLTAGGAALWLLVNPSLSVEGARQLGRPPRISPDYAGVVIPPNIAPLNLVVKGPGRHFCVRISGERGESIEVFDPRGRMTIPPRSWRKLLDDNRGGPLYFEVFVRFSDGTWGQYQRITNTVAPEEIDPYLVYREMPLYNLVWTDMGIYQRYLENYDVRTVLHNSQVGHGCMNCHTFLNHRTKDMLMNVRGHPKTRKPPGGMVLALDGEIRHVVDTKTDFNPIPAIYIAWHPSGKAVAFSTNKVLQGFHTVGSSRDVVDAYSDVGLYRIDTNTVTTIPEFSRPDRLETYPTWTPDGRTLYYCNAPQLPVTEYRRVRYDLMRITYDMETGAWGRPEVVIAAEDTRLSVTLPRASPDGKFLLFCMCEYGTFAPFSQTSDLYLMDLETDRYRKLDINSPRSEAYHSWSSNSRWFVFSSKRRDGLFTRLYLCYLDADGKAHKPFILPQRDPAFYESCIRICNVPELVREPVPFRQEDLARALYSSEMMLKAKLDPNVKPKKTTGPPPDEWYQPEDQIQ